MQMLPAASLIEGIGAAPMSDAAVLSNEARRIAPAEARQTLRIGSQRRKQRDEEETDA
jgi:hypothetical protein